MIYSGLDWSGDPGPTPGRFLVAAVVHVDESDLANLDSGLAAARVRLKWKPGFRFHHVDIGSKPDAHKEFYRALSRVRFEAHAYMLDKVAWHSLFGGKGSRGDDCICDAMSAVVLGCPSRVTAAQILYIDLPHKEKTAMTKYREVIRSALHGADRETFRHIK